MLCGDPSAFGGVVGRNYQVVVCTSLLYARQPDPFLLLLEQVLGFRV